MCDQLIDQLRQENISSHARLRQLQQANRELEEQISHSPREDLTTLRLEIERSARELEEIRNQVSEREAQVEKLQASIRLMQKEAHEIDRLYQQRRHQLEQERDELKRLGVGSEYSV